MTVHCEYEKDCPVSGIPLALIPIVVGNTHSAAHACKFQGTDDPLDIVGVDRFRGGGICLLKSSVQSLRPLCAGFLLQGSPVLCIGFHLREIYSVKKSLDIKAGASYQKREPALFEDLRDSGLRLLLETDYIPVLCGVGDIDQIMRDSLLFFFRDFCGTYVHAAVDLHRIGGYDTSVETPGQSYRCGCLPCGGRTGDDHKGAG